MWSFRPTCELIRIGEVQGSTGFLVNRTIVLDLLYWVRLMETNIRNYILGLTECGIIRAGAPPNTERLGRLTPRSVAAPHASNPTGIRHSMISAIRNLPIPKFRFPRLSLRKLPVSAWVGGVALSATTMLASNFESRPISVCSNSSGMAMGVSPLVSTQTFHAVGAGLDNSGGQQGGALNSKMANLLQIQLLEMGLERLEKCSEYRAVFLKQERISGSLTDMQEIQLKVKHAPLSVYMQWANCMTGREVLYVDGQNENKMLVHLEGVQGRLTGTLRLDPEGMLAMRESRHPVTDVGLKNLIETVLTFRRKEAETNFGFNCYCLDNQIAHNRKCILFITEYTSEESSPDYRKSMVYIDRETYMPVTVNNYGWPDGSDSSVAAAELDEQTLLESYSYVNPTFDAPLIASDFDPENKTYHFN